MLGVQVRLSMPLHFDRGQTVFHLPVWRWPPLMPYNGYTSAERIRSWQLQKFYEFNGWCQRQQQCCVTGALGIDLSPELAPRRQ
jgi:hypothetical protein